MKKISYYQLLGIAILSIPPSLLTIFSIQCGSPVSFDIRTLPVEYSFEKGSCPASTEQSQIKAKDEDEH